MTVVEVNSTIEEACFTAGDIDFTAEDTSFIVEGIDLAELKAGFTDVEVALDSIIRLNLVLKPVSIFQTTSTRETVHF